jgi:hypothetical protein
MEPHIEKRELSNNVHKHTLQDLKYISLLPEKTVCGAYLGCAEGPAMGSHFGPRWLALGCR